MNQVAYFEIQASDTEKAVDFYSKVFGWKFTEITGMPIKYFQIETNGMSGGLLQRPNEIPPLHCGTNAFTNSVEVADFDTTAELIIQNGGQIAMPKFEVPNKCWQGYFIDTDNNVFGIFQVF